MQICNEEVKLCPSAEKNPISNEELLYFFVKVPEKFSKVNHPKVLCK